MHVPRSSLKQRQLMVKFIFRLVAREVKMSHLVLSTSLIDSISKRFSYASLFFVALIKGCNVYPFRSWISGYSEKIFSEFL